MPRATVIFACVENAGRSQMAAALFMREIRDRIRARVEALIARSGWR